MFKENQDKNIVLDSAIEDCSIIIPDLAYREEGTSYHYIEESDSIEINPKYRKEFTGLLEKLGYKYTIGATWSTDAFYREMVDKIKYYKNLGVNEWDERSLGELANLDKKKNVAMLALELARIINNYGGGENNNE